MLFVGYVGFQMSPYIRCSIVVSSAKRYILGLAIYMSVGHSHRSQTLEVQVHFPVVHQAWMMSNGC